MPSLWTSIQDDVRHYADDSQLTIINDSNDNGLRTSNLIYQGMFNPDFRLLGQKIGRRWPEATQEDTSLTMVVGQEAYTRPTSPVFKDPFVIEGLDVNASNLPYRLFPASDMPTWTHYDNFNNSQPLYFRLLNVSGTVKLALRPNPDQVDPIRITGPIEITEFTTSTANDGNTKTAFINIGSDRALALFIAADYHAKRGQAGRASQLVTQGLGLLPLYDTTPVLRARGFIQPWPV